MCPDERLAGLWMVSPVSLEPRLSLALWSLREAISFFCLVKLSGSPVCVPASACRRSLDFGFAVFFLCPRLSVELFLHRRGLLLFYFNCVDFLNYRFRPRVL
ncbi:hypothetical protein NPIL_129271 [Nephila pilipes]|uniref:Uncharacterized protein n=1 Tax=Nephila pilipes TaxID=299642 RepID=A0A8X6NA11_NEPPI|nr:hypothetical protein NPIL_129271 [Nephila pilipes]